jgi:hypothetical protein
VLARGRLGGSAALAGVIAAGALTGCGTSSARTEAPRTGPPPPVTRLAHGHRAARVAVIVMENEEAADVLGSPDAPFINRLARTYALATESFAITHPSLPNYLALTGGSTFGIDSDCTDCKVNAAGLPQQLSGARRTWRAYMEGLPHSCFTGSGAGDYAKKHDPFVYYTGVSGNPKLCGNVVPLDALSADERRGTLPDFTWISPNLCHDMHDCSVKTGDRFLSGLVPPLLRALGPRGLLILTWDEGTSDAGCCRMASGGHIVTILAGGAARRGARLATPVDHYSVLQAIEDLLGLGRLRGAACACTPSLQSLIG